MRLVLITALLAAACYGINPEDASNSCTCGQGTTTFEVYGKAFGTFRFLSFLCEFGRLGGHCVIHVAHYNYAVNPISVFGLLFSTLCCDLSMVCSGILKWGSWSRLSLKGSFSLVIAKKRAVSTDVSHEYVTRIRPETFYPCHPVLLKCNLVPLV
jgi:hypothetical protein